MTDIELKQTQIKDLALKIKAVKAKIVLDSFKAKNEQKCLYETKTELDNIKTGILKSEMAIAAPASVRAVSELTDADINVLI